MKRSFPSCSQGLLNKFFPQKKRFRITLLNSDIKGESALIFDPERGLLTVLFT